MKVRNLFLRIKKINPIINFEKYIIKLINISLESIEKLVPLAKPSPYNERW